MKEIFIAYSVIALLSWFGIYGFMFAFWQRRFTYIAAQSYKQDMTMSVFLSFIGGVYWPVMWFIFYFQLEGFKYGFKIK